MLVVFTGNGKGKTTAALGQAVRAVGRGKRVLMVQFIKGPLESGEDFVEIRRKSDGQGEFVLRKMGLGFVGILGGRVSREKHSDAAKGALAYAKRELSKWDVIILDEVNVAVSLGLLGESDVLKAVRNFPREKLLVFTGRNAPEKFVKAADLVTEMREIKHPFQDGKLAEIGIEF